MPTLHSLDVAFDSETTPAVADQPVVMAYGYAVRPDGVGSGRPEGQRPRNIAQGSNFVFNVYDTTSNPDIDMVTQIDVFFGEGVTPFVGADGKTALKSPITMKSPAGSTDLTSVGCNVNGVGWATDTYTVLNDIANGTPYEFSVLITTKNGTFKVDPEVIIDGGNEIPSQASS
jgi:hypothetical protein